MKLAKNAALAVLLVFGSTAMAQQHGGHASAPAPYSGLQSREIKALSPEDAQRLLQGQGMSLALAAELNGYPGPMHVLEHAQALQLTAAQQEQTRSLMSHHKAQARELGAQLVEAERELDRAFARGTVGTDEIASMTARIAQLQGRLRASHLQTHLQQKALLTPEQIALYQQLRGYTTAQATQAHPHAGGHR